MSFVWGQKNERQYVFSGYLRSRTDSMGVAYAHVFVSSGRSAAVSNETGFFSLSVKVGDTLFFSAVQYVPRAIRITEQPDVEEVVIWMRERVYELPEVQVYARDLMQGFFSHRRINYGGYRPRDFLSLQPKIGLGQSTDPSAVGVTVDGLLSSLLLPLTSEYKQMKKVYELRRRQRMEHYYENLLTKRLSETFIQAYLPLRREEIRPFLDFWKPEATLLEEAEEYELIESLKEAKEKYIEHLLRTHSYRSYPDRVTTLELRTLLQTPSSDSENTEHYDAK